MNDNVVVVRFAETSKAYEALSVLKRLGDAGDLDVRSAVLLERGRIEAFSDGVFNDGDHAAHPRSQCPEADFDNLWRVSRSVALLPGVVVQMLGDRTMKGKAA